MSLGIDEVYRNARKLSMAVEQNLQRVSLMGAKEEDADALEDMRVKLEQVRGLISSMEQLVKQEPSAKRDLWKQKVANMRDEFSALEKSLDKELRRAGKNKGQEGGGRGGGAGGGRGEFCRGKAGS